MADRYVYHGGSNTSPYDTWAKAATKLINAISGASAGDDFWVASDHVETTAGSALHTFPGTSSSPNRIISVSRAGSTPPGGADVAPGASVSTTGASTLRMRGTLYMYGLTLNAGSTTSTCIIEIATSAGNRAVLEACALNLLSSSASGQITLGGDTSIAELDNSSLSFASTSQGIAASSSVRWTNSPAAPAVAGATIPTTLFAAGANSSRASIRLSGLDLSSLGSGKTIFGAAQSDQVMINCKLDASVVVAATPTNKGAQGTDLIGCNSTGNVRRDERYRNEGTLTTETTIKRTAGASDGTTSYCWKVASTASAQRTFPFETFEGALWNSTTGASKTLTVHTVTDNVTLTDAEIWLEVEYLGSSATPVTTLITDANATVLTTAANQTSDSSETWTTTGLTTPIKQKLEVSFTPQMAGPIRWRVKVAKASTTVYVCPKADLT